MYLLSGHGVVSEKNVTPKAKEELPHLAREIRELRASSLAGAYCEVSIRESNSNFESQRFGFRLPTPNTPHGLNVQWVDRFRSSFKMMDSAISFIDLRRCWLSRCIVR